MSQPGKSLFSGHFEVQSYQLEPVSLTFDLKKTVVYRGEMVEGDLNARYQYGEPLASRPIEVSLPDGRTLHGTTDAGGKYHLEFSTEGFAEEQTLQRPPRRRRTTYSEVGDGPPRSCRGSRSASARPATSTSTARRSGSRSSRRTPRASRSARRSLTAALVKQVTVEGRCPPSREVTR